jgi:hypothetical protein
MSQLSIVINDNLEQMVNAKDRCVELTSTHKDLLTVAYIEDNGALDQLMAEDMTSKELDEFQVDMTKAFAGLISHDGFFLKYENFYQKAKDFILEDIETKIWNRYCDIFNPPPIDYYEEYGVTRSWFA